MEKRQNFSKKREAILTAIQSTTSHPSAEWVYQKLKPDYPDLSLGTVYRNISQFKQNGLLICVGVVNGQERFDGNVKPHTHFVCSQCGAVIDIAGEFVGKEWSSKIAERYHVRVDSNEVLFRGICAKCLGEDSEDKA